MNQSFEKSTLSHQPVLYQEIINALRPKSSGCYIDATVGAGGHAWGLLQASSPAGRLLGLDVDPQALVLASQRLAIYEDRVKLVQASYARLREQMQRLNWEKVDGIVMDLGVSSMQLKTPERGFSFQTEGPLDMRFDPRQTLTADTLVNELPEKELTDLIWRFGEESNAKRIARAICNSRPLHTTRELAEVIQRVSGRNTSHIHPATRTFQALRIAVNQELRALEEALPQAVEMLAPGGRLAVISFHSLEDRIIKQYFRQESRDCICPPHQPICTCGHRASIKLITRRPIQANLEEIQTNPKARSAHLRVAEKLELA